MTIDQAIEELEALQGEPKGHYDSPQQQALDLGIEALKTIMAERSIYGFKRQARLPGETEN